MYLILYVNIFMMKNDNFRNVFMLVKYRLFDSSAHMLSDIGFIASNAGFPMKYN